MGSRAEQDKDKKRHIGPKQASKQSDTQIKKRNSKRMNKSWKNKEK
jgi:hypothetical protein